MLGTSLSRRRSAAASAVTRERGRRRAPYPPTTVSLWTKPSAPLRSASTTLIPTPDDRNGSPGLLGLRGLGHVGGGETDAAGRLLSGVIGVLDRHLGACVRGQ